MNRAMNPQLETLLQDSRLWQGHKQNAGVRSHPTGHRPLDQAIGGWPKGALSECLLDAPGIGELQLVQPLLRTISQGHRSLYWINPPCIPYAPALARSGINLDRLFVIHTRDLQDCLWTMESCLRSAGTGAVMAWPGRLQNRDIRRLQLAAEAGDALCLLFRDRRLASHSSPAALRLILDPAAEERLQVQILKRRGGWPGQQITLPLSRLPEPVPEPAVVVRGPWPPLPSANA